MSVLQTQLINWTLVSSPGTTVTTASVTVPRLALAFVSICSTESTGGALDPTSVTFNADSSAAIKQDSVAITSFRQMSLWYSQSSIARTGTIAIAVAAGQTSLLYRVDSFSSVIIDIAGNGGNAIVQENITNGKTTAPTVTLAGNLQSQSALFGIACIDSKTTTFTPDASFTRLGTDTNNGASTTVSSEWWQTPAVTNTTVDYTISATQNWGIMGIEIGFELFGQWGSVSR